MSSNKGELPLALVTLVLVVVALLVLLLVSNAVGSGILNFLNGETCAQEVRAHAVTNTVTKYTEEVGGQALAPEINCPTKYKSVDETGDAMKERISEEMLHCWQTWGKGELDLFKEETGHFCHRCTVLEFEETEKMSGESFLNYMSDNPRPKDSYLAGILPFSSGEIEDISYEEQEMPDIDTSVDYDVVFHYMKGEETIAGFLSEEAAHKTGAVAVGLASAYVGVKTGGAIGGMACSWTGPAAAVCSAIGAVGGGAIGGSVGLVMYATSASHEARYAQVSLIPHTSEGLSQSGCEMPG